MFVVIGIGGSSLTWCWPIWRGYRPWCCRSLGCVRCGLVRRRIEWLHKL